ncbi:MAG: type II toxin-antitoxin system PemK/MazF family toxin [Acidobacteriota bacterium]
MTTCKRGDIVLVSFVFADEKGVKKRPALVLSSDAYHSGRQEVIVAAITSNVDRILVGDYTIKDWEVCDLPMPSVVTGIVRTIKQNMIVKKLGTLPSPERKSFDKHVKSSLSL